MQTCTQKRARKCVKKAASFLTSVAMIFSCGLAETMAAVSASAASATTMYIYDENGKDISSNPILYLDNSTIGGGETTTSVKVKVDSSDDPIVYALDAASSKIVETENSMISSTEMQLDIDATYDKNLNPNTGTAKIRLTTSSGETYRDLTIVVYNPANCLTMKFGDAELFTGSDGKHSCAQTVDGVLAVANHKYQFTGQAEATTTANKKTSTDAVEYEVVDGAYSGVGTKPAASTKAEIDDTGLFTPKTNGTVTVIAKFKETETSKRVKTEDGYVPKYIQVVIVKENPATALKFNNPIEALGVGETYQLDLNKTPTYSDDTGATDEITWTSSNEKVLTVDSKGLVTAVGKGDATITARAENDTVFTSCDISVITKATSISISPSPTSTRVGVGVELTATMSPTTADDEIVWSINDPTIAQISTHTSTAGSNTQKAVIVGLKEGTCIVTAKAKNSGVEAKCTVTVNAKIASTSLKVTYAEGDEIVTVPDNGTVDIYTLKDVTFDATLMAEDGSTPDDEIIWTVTGNEGDYITINSQVDKSISIHGSSKGTVTLTATSKANSSITQSFTVNVLRASDKATMQDASTGANCTSKSVNVGYTLGLTVDYTIEGNYPYNHDDVIDSWTSSDESIATVSSKGVVTAKANGTAKITATSKSGRTAICTVTVFTTSSVSITGVTASPDGVSLPTATLALNAQGTGTKTMAATVKNQNNATVGNCDKIWTSSNESVAVISNTGVVTPKDVGVTTITVKSGAKTESCLLYITFASTNFTIEAIPVQYYSPLTAEYTPKPAITIPAMDKALEEGVDYTLTYANNTKVGTATITVTGLGNYTSSKNVTFQIARRPLTDDVIQIDEIPTQEYLGSAVTPEPNITFQGYILKKGTDYSVTYTNNTKVGTGKATITGIGNYTGSTYREFAIECGHPNAEITVTKAATCSEEGSRIVKCSTCNQTITEAIPKLPHTLGAWTVTKAATVSATGTKTATCSVCGEKVTETIPKLINISTCTITTVSSSYGYTGSALTPTVTVKNGTKTLTKGTDYTVAYKNNTNAGTATITVTGKGAYGGTATKTFTITARSLANCQIELVSEQYFRGTRIKPVVTVKNGNTVIPSTNYKVGYTNNLSVGTAKVTIVGINSLKGEVVKTFEIVQRSIGNCDIELAQSKYYFTNARIKPELKVYCNGVEMYSGNYTVSYTNNLSVGTATITLTGMKNLKGTTTKTFDINPRGISACTVTLTKNSSNAYQPLVSVAYYGREIYSGNYTVSYKTSTDKKTVTVTLTGKNNLTGTVTKTYTVS